jgi:hypothetical protein
LPPTHDFATHSLSFFCASGGVSGLTTFCLPFADLMAAGSAQLAGLGVDWALRGFSRRISLGIGGVLGGSGYVSGGCSWVAGWLEQGSGGW